MRGIRGGELEERADLPHISGIEDAKGVRSWSRRMSHRLHSASYKSESYPGPALLTAPPNAHYGLPRLKSSGTGCVNDEKARPNAPCR